MIRSIGHRRLDAAACAAAAVGAGLIGVTIASGPVSLRGVQIGLGVVLVGLGLMLDDEASDIPRVLRPAPLILLSALVGSLSIGLLTDQDYEGAYFGMWLCQVSGFLLAILVRPHLRQPLVAPRRISDPERLRTYGSAVFAIGAVSALAFFALKGVPFFAGGVEQARVDAASSGTGYIRVLAFMTGPAAIILFAAEHPKRWYFLALAALLIALFGNRVPLVYLGLPVLAMAAIVGRRITSGHLVAAAVVALVGVAVIGTYRVFTQPDFRKYQEYRVDLAQDDKLGVALTSVTHYAEVIPANAVLVKRLVDDNRVSLKFGTTYGTLFLSALPGQQLSPDLLIKQASGRDFVGGGTPPTLMGEGYMNGKYIGVILSSFLVMWLARYWASVATQTRDRMQRRVNAGIYGYVITWCAVAQVAGLAGAATIPLAGFLLLLGLRWAARPPEPRGAGLPG